MQESRLHLVFRSVLAALGTPRAPRVILLAALLLSAPALGTGFLFDDYVLALKARSQTVLPGMPADPLWLFSFTSGREADNRVLIDSGTLLPWWSEPRHLNAFFRPISSLTHVLDFALWPNAAWLMHAHSLAWYALLCWLVLIAYRRLAPKDAHAGAVSLAFLLFAFDEAHGMTFGWIANRNALVAVTLALPMIWLHARARSEGSRSAAALAALAFACGLAGGETAVSVLGYVVAYALVLDRGTWRARVLSLVPYVALLGVHRGIYRALDLGSFGSSAYHDPLRETGAFVANVAFNAPVLVAAQLGTVLADVAFWSDPLVRPGILLVSLLTLAAVGWALASLLARDAHARYWALGTLLSAVPVSASLPGVRLLLCLGIGASALLARFFVAVFEGELSLPRPARFIAFGLLLAQAVGAPLALPVAAGAMGLVSKLTDDIEQSVPRSGPLESQTLLVPNAPFDAALSFLQPMRAARGTPRPARVRWLASASSELSVTRVAARTLRLSLAQGFLRRPEETHYRSDATTLGLGARVALSDMDVRIVQLTDDGRPATIEVELAHPLDSTRYLPMCFRDGKLVPWQPPQLGATQIFPAQDFFQVILSEAWR